MGVIAKIMHWIGLEPEPQPPRHPWMKAMDRIKIQNEKERERKDRDGDTT